MTNTAKHVLAWSLILGLLGWFITSVSAVLLPFVLGLMMAYLLDPVVDQMIARNIRRSTATAIVTIISFSLLVVILATALPLIGKQLVHLLEVLPEHLSNLYHAHSARVEQIISRLPGEQSSTIEQAINHSSSVAAGVIKNVMGTLFASSAALLNILSLLMITPVVAFYLLRDWDNIVSKVDGLLPRQQADIIRTQLHKMDETISGFLRGQIMVCSLLALFYVIGLTLMGLNFSVVIGASAGFLIIIPYAGWFVAASIGMIVAIIQYESMTNVAIIGAIFLMGQVLEGYFLTPKLVGDRVGLHPVWIIFGMLAGGVLLGFVGVLLAIPLAAIIGVLIRFAMEQYKHSELYLGSPGGPGNSGPFLR